jgi:alkylation response protein AidB-like acyl-CoA dehydrogenase
MEKDTIGLSIGRNVDKMGLRTSPMSDLGFNNCRIPASNLIGQEGAGGIIFASSMEWERGLMLANCTGIMERQLSDCLRVVNTRKKGGQGIGRYQSIAHKIAEMKVRLETSRLLLYKTAWLKSQKKAAALESSAAKLFISESYIQNCHDALQIYTAMNGYGDKGRYELERELRDARASTVYSGTSEIHKNIISSILL